MRAATVKPVCRRNAVSTFTFRLYAHKRVISSCSHTLLSIDTYIRGFAPTLNFGWKQKRSSPKVVRGSVLSRKMLKWRPWFLCWSHLPQLPTTAMTDLSGIFKHMQTGPSTHQDGASYQFRLSIKLTQNM